MTRQRMLEHRVVTPAIRRYARPLLLFHGAWHGAWCWEGAMHNFAQRGFVVHAISLRGHGASDPPGLFNLSGVDAYLRDLDAAIASIEPTPIVIAHSMGGYLMQHYLARCSLPLPGVVLLCALPHTGALRFFWQWVVRHPVAALRTVFTLNTRHLVGTPGLARKAFFQPTIPDAELAIYMAKLCPEAVWVSLETLFRLPCPQPGGTPLLVIAAEHDVVFTLDEQRALAAAYHAELVVIAGAAHDAMLDPAWPTAADCIERAVAQW